MRKKLGIITSSFEVGKAYKRQLLQIFNDAMEIVCYSFDQQVTEDVWHADALLISTKSQYEILKNKISPGVPVVIAQLTLSKEGYELLSESKVEKKVALVNLSFEMCIETIATLNQLGFGEMTFVPIYPNMNKLPKLSTAVTTGERRFVPREIHHVLDLGHRVIDKNTIVDLAIALGLEEALENQNVVAYFQQIVSNHRGYEYFIEQSRTFKKQFNTLLSIMEKGVIGFNHAGVIESCNENAIEILGSKEFLKGKHIDAVFPKELMQSFFRTRKRMLNKLIKLNERNITVSLFPISDMSGEPMETDLGSYMILESFETQENTQNMLRLQLANKGHVAKYSVDHIVGESEAIRQVKALVTRMGNSESAVMITGESGTGKELIAQAIHNVSPVRDKQFVAINCAAISPSLLESELFGYEAGAFTGALKDGKSGIFELAHNGTLFLDEIGEMPLDLQSRFLRVIQEGEVMRVGGQKVIKVNTRLVAATNRDLYQLVQENKFRKDLYYRLNVLPINVPPLRERKGDVELLFDYFQKVQGCRFELAPQVLDFLNAYEWDGNIRELRNCVKYFENVGVPVITMEDLPFHMQKRVKAEDERQPAGDKARIVSRPVGGLSDQESFVLRLFYQAFREKKKLGRKSIAQKAYEHQVFLSEYEVRRILKDLERQGLVCISKGRGGSTISSKGIDMAEEN